MALSKIKAEKLKRLQMAKEKGIESQKENAIRCMVYIERGISERCWKTVQQAKEVYH
jgi:hypothetical protein